MKLVKFKRRNSWPCPVDKGPEDSEITTLEVDDSETYVKNGQLLYKLVCGHGLYFELPVEPPED